MDGSRHSAAGIRPELVQRRIHVDCAPKYNDVHHPTQNDASTLRALDRTPTSEQEERLSHFFRLGLSSLRQMAHAELGCEAIRLLVARDVDHWCERCT